MDFLRCMYMRKPILTHEPKEKFKADHRKIFTTFYYSKIGKIQKLIFLGGRPNE